jgi:hypothetical protein
MAYLLKILNILLLSTVKYFYTPIYAHMIGVDFWTTALTMIPGGIAGFLIYYHFSKILLLTDMHIKPRIKSVIPNSILQTYRHHKQRRKLRRKNKRKFTRKNRALVRLTNKYGMYTIIILTPILISLVLGAFLLRKYYPNRKEAAPLMIVSIVVEGFLLCAGYWFFMGS